MVVLASGTGAAAAVTDAPRIVSGRETLDIPEPRSDLSVLRLDAPANNKPRPACDAPPSRPITFGASSRAGDQSEWGNRAAVKHEGPSLMEQMMAEAMAAREENTKEERKEHRKDTKKGFGGGLKKGFLTQSSTTGASQKSKKGGREKKKSLDGSSSSGAARLRAGETRDSMPVISGRRSNTGGLDFDVSSKAGATDAGLVLPDVQEALKHSADSVGITAGSMGNSGEWLTPELLDKISRKPRMAAMLNDPRFAKAMQLMARSPKEALEMFASNPEARDTFTELMALLAEHFKEMGTVADEEKAAQEAERKRVQEGPLAREALRRAAEGVGVTASSPPSDEETAHVERVLEQPELRELLTDPGMQRVLQECGEPAALARYMRHSEYGPKLQLMARAGLVSFRH